MERQMTEAVTITNEELAILCDIVAGWSVKKAESLDRGKQQALDRLIANGFVEQANGRSVAKYQHTAKTDLLFTQLCVGISGGVNASVPMRGVTAAAHLLSHSRRRPRIALKPSPDPMLHSNAWATISPARPPFYWAFSGVVCSIPCDLPYCLRHHVIFGPAQVGGVAQNAVHFD